MGVKFERREVIESTIVCDGSKKRCGRVYDFNVEKLKKAIVFLEQNDHRMGLELLMQALAFADGWRHTQVTRTQYSSAQSDWFCPRCAEDERLSPELSR